MLHTSKGLLGISHCLHNAIETPPGTQEQSDFNYQKICLNASVHINGKEKGEKKNPNPVIFGG